MSDAPITEWLREGAAAPRSGASGPPADRADPWRPAPDPADGGRARRLWRVVGAAWAVLVLLVAALFAGGRLLDPETAAAPGGDGRPAGDAVAERGGAEPGGAASAVTEPGGAESAGASAGDEAPAGDERTAGLASPGGSVPAGPSTARVSAAAAVAVRLALTADGPAPRYVDLVVPEQVEQHGDVVVVTVAAVLLEGEEGRWTSVRPARYGVAVDVGGAQPSVLGDPWALPAGGAAVAVAGEPIALPPDVDVEALAAALSEAGYREASVQGALPGAAAPLLVVRVEAVGPGERKAATHDVWLTRGGELRVLGLPEPP